MSKKLIVNLSNSEAKAIVDSSDGDLIKKYNWFLDKASGYVKRSYWDGKMNRQVRLHREVMGANNGQFVDHINGNRLDNRRCNLRFCTIMQNTANAKQYSNNTTGHKGVWWAKNRNKYVAGIGYNNRQIHLGIFENIEDAIATRIEAEKKYFGEFRRELKEEINKNI